MMMMTFIGGREAVEEADRCPHATTHDSDRKKTKYLNLVTGAM